jgi:hypothetical protein
MSACTTCGSTDVVRLYQRRDAPDAPRSWLCVDCVYFAARLQGIALDPVPAWVERAALRELPLRPVEHRLDRRVCVGRRASDRAVG